MMLFAFLDAGLDDIAKLCDKRKLYFLNKIRNSSVDQLRTAYETLCNLHLYKNTMWNYNV